MTIRDPSESERRLLRYLAEASKGPQAQDWLEDLALETMDDGGMGSLRLLPRGTELTNHCFGMEAGTCRFADDDGVPVFATLYLNTDGVPFELDVWKVDFSSTIRIPASFEISE